jgi:hypothetical protein
VAFLSDGGVGAKGEHDGSEQRARRRGGGRSEMGEAFICPATHGDKAG